MAAVDALLSGNVGADEALERALAADPDFALAHAARARALQMRGAAAEARMAATRAGELARTATRREQGHVEAVSLALGPDLPRALAGVREHLREFPRDALVLSLVTGVYSLTGFSGRPDRNDLLLGILDEVAPDYGDDWWFLNVHAFACTEAGDRARGRRLVERSLSRHPRNAHAAHALAHVFYEEGDSAGISRSLSSVRDVPTARRQSTRTASARAPRSRPPSAPLWTRRPSSGAAASGASAPRRYHGAT